MINNFIEIKLCPVCNNPENQTIFIKKNFRGLRCRNCGLIFINPRISNTEKFYLDNESSSSTMYYQASAKLDGRVFENRLSLLEEFDDNRSILDVGCNIGTFLLAAKNRGWKHLVGIEPNPEAVKVAASKDFKVINGFIEGLLLDEYTNAFSSVNMGDVIEHFPDPVKVIRLIQKLLTKNGKLMIITPNYDSIMTKLFQIKPYEHLYYFSASSLTYLLEKNGFSIKICKSASRKRSFKGMVYSTTFRSQISKLILRIMYITGIGIICNLLIKLFIKDELFVIACKNE